MTTGKAHLVGGMAFETADEAMRAVGQYAGAVVDWVPDGETGVRRKWMSQHRTRFDAQGALDLKPLSVRVGSSPEVRGGRHGAGAALYGLAEGSAASDVRFETFGYVEPARESFEIFATLKRDGVLPPTARFMVAIPSPSGITDAFVHHDDRLAVHGSIENGLFADVLAIVDAIPSDQLAFQWDVATEFSMLTDLDASEVDDALSTVVEQLARAGDAVPENVPLGYHLCYGAAYDVHFIEPEDTALMARVMAGVLGKVDRPISRFHMPVPIERVDLAYFEPLREVPLGEATELYLGLIHHEDGVDGARRRIAAAKRVIEKFGVGTECGMGRTLADPIALLRLHTEVAAHAAKPADPGIDVPRDPLPRRPVDPAEINQRLRRLSEQVACAECGATVGEPCRGDDATELSRPHMDRYHAALLGTIKGRLAPMQSTAAD